MSGSTNLENKHPVTGIKTTPDDGLQYVRKDIDDWYNEQIKKPPVVIKEDNSRVQLTLFMRALEILQCRDVDDEVSYFRLAGIHGAPFCEWGGESPVKGDGFCVHGDYTFPTWHRVYVALYEQELHKAMKEFITSDKVPEKFKKQWEREADEWRLPYWDFARNVSHANVATAPDLGDTYSDKFRLPILCMMPSVRIVAFDGDAPYLERIDNPLYKYESSKPMGELPEKYRIEKEKQHADPKKETPEFFYPWDKCTATTKYGILDSFHEDIWADGGQNWLRANFALNEHCNKELLPKCTPVPTLQDKVFRLFQTELKSWGAFATTKYPKEENAKEANSVESVHNNVHNFVGGSSFIRPDGNNIHLWGAGHMSSTTVAAFDPIFWLHHCNIDRLTAIWQALNGSGGQNENGDHKKWFDDEYSAKARYNDLTPFRKPDGQFYKSDDVEKWRDLNYDYGILQDDQTGTKKKPADRETIINRVCELYGDHVRDLYARIPDSNNKTDDEKERDDYVITVVYNKYALCGAPYTINVFLGEVSAGSYSGPGSQGFVGSIYNFSGSLENCPNCKKQAEEGVKHIAQVPATIAARHFIRNNLEVPQPRYVALNTLGKPVSMDVEIKLHKANRSYYKHPVRPDPRDPLSYMPIKNGKQAEIVPSA
ncbi:tyrosinase [Aspergillus melleus]|uniref:tyrosinase n=1 Tax=Aspergillus melleus TaxID=138277 RepID=UPI001E8EF177|nr:uncharacterized protein LDX57_010343 [Aspergillus melleus]KAH8432716.1 hypothetical protein LDX57_010343 [Aspergillus melleus]